MHFLKRYRQMPECWKMSGFPDKKEEVFRFFCCIDAPACLEHNILADG